MKPRPTSRLAFPLASAIASLLAAQPASATNLYWDTNGTGTAGSGAHTGTWGSSVFWSTDSTGLNVGPVTLTAATTNADDLFFSAGTNGTAGTVTVSGTQSAHSITFEELGVTLSGGTINLGSATAGSGMFFANTASHNVNAPIILNSAATEIAFANRGNQTVTFGATGTITGSATTGIQNITIGGTTGGTTFNGSISDGGAGGKVGVTVLGAGTYTLAAANTYTGATNILSGTLQINNASALANTSAINMTGTSRLNVNAANTSLAKLSTANGGGGVVAGSFLRYSTAQTAAGASNGPGTIFGTVELNLTNVNPNYTLDFGAGGALTNVLAGAVTYTSALTLSGTASIDSSQAVATNTATYNTGGITASTAGTKTLNLSGSNTGANTISGAIGDGSGTIGVTKGGGGTWVLSGTNTYTGNTRVDLGTLQFVNTASLYNSTTGSWTAANIRVGNGGTLALNVGGTNQFTTGNVTTLLTNLGGANGTSTTGFAAGSAIGFDTTNASGSTFTVADVLANSSGIGGGAIGLTKLGTNTLVLSNDNTYTGRTVISAGTLQLGTGGLTGKLSTSSAILNNGTLTINRSDAVAQGTDFSAAPITGTGAFIKLGGGATTLNAANTFTGSTTVTAGQIILTNALALQNSAYVTTGSNGTTIGLDVTGALTSGNLTLGGLSGAVNLASAFTAGFTGSVSNLTLNPQGTQSNTYSGIIANGTMSLTKTGTGTQILSGANTYTGDTFVNGGTLTVGSGATGSLSSSSALKMGGGSTFNYARTGTGQTVNGLTINAGNSIVNNTSGQTLTLAAITRTGSAFGTVNFGATTLGTINTTTTNVDGIIGPWATTGATTTLRYAVGGGNISALTGTTATAADLSNLVAGGNFEYSAATTTVGNLTANTLRYSGGNSTTTIGATNTLTLNGLMNAGSASTLLISGGPSTGGIIIGSTNELVIAANAQNTTISAVIKDGGAAGRLVYSGGGTVTLSGLNTYTGGLVINSGIVATAAAASVSSGGTGTGPITINAAGRLQLLTGVGTLNRAITLNGGTLQFNGSGSDLAVAGTIVLAANSTIDATANNSGNAAINSNISGAGGFTKAGAAGGLRLNGTNTYTGPTVVSIGGLTVKSSLYNNVTSNWTPANITVAGGATLALNVGGGGEFTIAQAHTMFSQLSSNVNNNGLQAGSFIAVDTRNAPNGTYTYSGNITDSTGAGGGSVSFKHVGTANHILELTGSNTYSGMTIVDGNAFLKVSSLNSVFTNAALGTVHSASSSLGAPTTVLNGTIQLGTAGNTAQGAVGNSFDAGGLIYTGTGETTDRIISMNDGGGKTSTLDQSGTGLLKFISSFATLDGRGTKTLLLQGSTTGTGEIAGVIPNATSNSGTVVTKSGTGTWTLSGANLYAGVTTVNGGTLRFAKQVSLYNNTEASWTKTNIIVNSTGTLALNVGGTGEFTTSNVTTLLTNLSTSINNNGLRSGSTIGFDTTNAAGGTFTVADNISNSTGTGSGAVGLTKLGTNTLVLTGTNAHTGATNVNAGKLLINGSTSTSSAVTVASGATLGGSGTVGGAVTIQAGGTFSPGNSIESIATGNLALLASATFAQEIDKSVAAGVSGDLTATTGTLSITSGAILTLAELGTSGAWTAGDRITLIGYSTGTWNGGLFTYLGNTLNDDSTFTFSGIDWTFDYNDLTAGDNYNSDLSAFTGSARYVTMTAIPEPRAALLGGIGMLMLLRRRRG